MKIEERELGDVRILEVSGRITIGGGDVRVRDAVVTALEGGWLKVVLDMSRVKALDSAGVGELVAAYTSVSNRGARLKLAGVPPRVSDVLQFTQLILVLDVEDDVDAAVAAFGGD